MQQDAANALTGAGYQVQVKEFNSTAAKGTVIGESPQSNQPPGTTITIWVSTGSHSGSGEDISVCDTDDSAGWDFDNSPGAGAR
jgi:beta-lactam-binding protein with PASTA domain